MLSITWRTLAGKWNYADQVLSNCLKFGSFVFYNSGFWIRRSDPARSKGESFTWGYWTLLSKLGHPPTVSFIVYRHWNETISGTLWYKLWRLEHCVAASLELIRFLVFLWFIDFNFVKIAIIFGLKLAEKLRKGPIFEILGSIQQKCCTCILQMKYIATRSKSRWNNEWDNHCNKSSRGGLECKGVSFSHSVEEMVSALSGSNPV